MEWLKQNAWAIAIALMTVVTTFALYGYRLDSLESQVMDSQRSIKTLAESNVTLQITLAKIQTDIEYIKLRLDRIIK
jgi:hypothetical protein